MHVDYRPYWAARAALLARTCAYREALDAQDITIDLELNLEVRFFAGAAGQFASLSAVCVSQDDMPPDERTCMIAMHFIDGHCGPNP